MANAAVRRKTGVLRLQLSSPDFFTRRPAHTAPPRPAAPRGGLSHAPSLITNLYAVFFPRKSLAQLNTCATVTAVTHDDRLLLLKFSQSLHQKKARIIEDWLQEVHEDRRIQASEQISRTGLIDHLPKLLDSVVELLRVEGGEHSEVINEDARKHGSYRWEQGYKLDEVVRELMIFRGVMIRHLVEIEAEIPVPSSVRLLIMERLHRLLDELAWGSTQQFVIEQQRSLIYANESRSRLIRNMSHELRNVLNGLGLAAELIEDEDAEPVREMRITLHRNVGHMKELLDDLLDLSALVNGQQVVRPLPFQPAHLLKHVEAVYRPMAAAKGLTLHLNCDPGLTNVIGDERKIQQVITNLLSNAIKYTEHGEIRLACRSLDDDRWSVCVADTGAGISKADQKEIFSEFYRVESTSSERGVGLGLAISCRLVELLSGELRLTSALGVGSTFEVLFPREFKPGTVGTLPKDVPGEGGE